MANERKKTVMSDSVTTLGEQIMEDARKQAEPVKRRAQQKANDIIERARQEAEEAKEQILQEAREKAEAEVQRIEARMELDIENIRRQKYEDELRRVREKAEEYLKKLTESDDYRRALRELALVAIQSMSGNSFELILRNEDREYGPDLVDYLRREASSQSDDEIEVNVGDDTVQGMGGLKVRRRDGKQICNETFDARLERLWPLIRQEIAEDMGILDEVEAKAKK
jgi:V/A-type H+-transporting ATPase subunit E